MMMRNNCGTNHNFTAFVVVFVLGSLMTISSIASAQSIVGAAQKIKGFTEAENIWKKIKSLTVGVFKDEPDVQVQKWYDPEDYYRKTPPKNEHPAPPSSEKVGRTKMCKGVAKGIDLYNHWKENNDTISEQLRNWYLRALRIQNYCAKAADETIAAAIKETSGDAVDNGSKNVSATAASPSPSPSFKARDASLSTALGMAAMLVCVVLCY